MLSLDQNLGDVIYNVRGIYTHGVCTVVEYHGAHWQFASFGMSLQVLVSIWVGLLFLELISRER
jgi:hypothetical protein